ncbi:Hypothetical protein R9X50_00786000 [Acrodontium crateriforme]|uniref:Uncharacterized protein n=1 Tax=Acrodontium crateriforme TaxID=150365 RepID=A0AAQ3REC2_9PEZI|nr:Hypothetical protein R9X50_00786000 [Acrodontium crateriforme]
MENESRPSSSFGLQRPLQTPPSPAGSYRRRVSYTPSYMSFQNGSAPISKPVPIVRKPSQPSRLPFKPERVLIIAIAGQPEPSVINSLSALLKKDSYSGIVIIGSINHATQIKKLKMDVLFLVGRLGKELEVQMHLKENWADLKDVLGGVRQIGSVMCYPFYQGTCTSETELLSFEQNELESSWRSSVGFLHSMARSTFPLLQKQKSETPPVFLLVDTPATSPTASLNKETCEALLKRLTKANTSNLVIEILAPEKETVEPKTKLSLDPPVELEIEADSNTFRGGESPTRLWNMWALQEQIDAA